jgi:regulator of protease activity HflC (stomatin/prohibitin superfamily)
MDLISPAWILLVVLALVLYAFAVRIVPQQSAYIAERLGRYHATLTAGLNFIIPFVDRITYRHTLKEQAIDIPEQICITKDNVQVGVDGVLFLRVVDAQKASYGIGSYLFAITQLAQTTLRSEMGKIDLDKTFEERANINASVVSELDKASEPWGVKVLRYEIKNITPPKDVLAAMEKQMRAEREKRAVILTSEGERDAINCAEGTSNRSSNVRFKAAADQRGAGPGRGSICGHATAQAIRQVAASIAERGGMEAINLRVAEQWITQFGNVAKETNTLILPTNLADVASLIGAAMSTLKKVTAPPSQ